MFSLVMLVLTADTIIAPDSASIVAIGLYAPVIYTMWKVAIDKKK